MSAPPSPVEKIKTASRLLRGSLAESVADPLTGALREDDTQLIKFHGSYQQDDRDLREERRLQKLEPAYSFMIRTRLPGGAATPRQWLAMDAISDEFQRDVATKEQKLETLKRILPADQPLADRVVAEPQLEADGFEIVTERKAIQQLAFVIVNGRKEGAPAGGCPGQGDIIKISGRSSDGHTGHFCCACSVVRAQNIGKIPPTSVPIETAKTLLT